MTICGLTIQELSAITSIFAVFISTCALIVSIISGISQRRHNKNSVRPISAIKAKDYEDFICVSIQNVGTGPLTIEKLLLKDSTSNRKCSTLIELMPKIDSIWNDYVECCDGWTIQVGTEMKLIALNSCNEQDKENVRKALSAITVLLDYKDIYNQRFHDERKLDFFSRHYTKE